MAVGDVTERGEVLFEARAGMDRTGRIMLLVVIPLACLLAIPYAFLRNPDGSTTENLVIIGVAYLILLVTILLTWGHLNARFQVTPTHVVRSRMLRSPLVVARSEVAEAVLTPAYAVLGAHGPRAILLGHDGRALLTSNPLRELADLEGLVQVTPHVTRVPVLKPAEASERWPRMLPWSHANPKLGVLAGVGIVLGLIVVAVVLAVLFG